MLTRRSAPHVRVLAVLGAAVLVLAACGSDDDDTEPAKRGKPGPIALTIGNSVPLSGSLREFGPDAERAAELAVDQITEAIEKAGVDHEVDLVTVDNGSNTQEALATARELVADGAGCIVGPWGAADTLSVARSVAVPEHVALISPAATLDELTDLTDSGLVSRTAAPDSAQGAALATAIADDLGDAKGKTVNVAARDDAYGENLASSFIDAWTEDGGKVGNWFNYDVDRESPGAIAKDLVADDPDATLIFDFAASFTRLAPALAETAGYDPKTTWGADLLASTELPEDVPSGAIQGLRGTLQAAPDGEPASAAFRNLFAKESKEAPGQFAAQTFDAVVLCYLAAVAAGSPEGAELGPFVPSVSSPEGKEVTWEKLPEAIEVLERGKEVDYTGASGQLDINVHGDPTAATYDIYEFSGDQVLLVDQVSIGRGSADR